VNTETGRIYPPDEYDERLSAQFHSIALDDHQADFERARAEGKIAEVSAAVAQKVQLGERELERRARRRKAAKQARKGNRG
jgi:hypothetical protein